MSAISELQPTVVLCHAESTHAVVAKSYSYSEGIAQRTLSGDQFTLSLIHLGSFPNSSDAVSQGRKTWKCHSQTIEMGAQVLESPIV